MSSPSNTIAEHTFSELPDIRIPLSDGRRLAARIWLPDTAETEPVPAILEYLPYRKRDGTADRDESTYPVFAKAGYAGIRVDIAGHGESDGRFDDEYSAQELADGVEVIHWIAGRPWCNGNVGMMGISWGGFNALQLGAIHPEPLKAVISLNSVVDRYNDDIHYRNGCQLNSNFGWASVMLCYASRAPDPALRSDWRSVWLDRLETLPWLLPTWLSHQRRDSYWQHGSICEDFAGYRMPTLIIGGWADLYKNAPVELLSQANPETAVVAINGPWIHKYPHFARPHPRLDFHREALQWWDRWLKNRPPIEYPPRYRAFVSENTRVQKRRETEFGRWVGIDSWPPADTRWSTLFASIDHRLVDKRPPATHMQINSSQDCGISCGEIFTRQTEGELPGDQRIDNAGSLCFSTAPLPDALEILGAPVFDADVAINQPYGNLIVRLLDIHPDGMAHRISWGVLNLAHRHGFDSPSPMQAGRAEPVHIQLDQCAYRLLPGHRLGLAISTAYWPAVLPPPFDVTATISIGTCRIAVPRRPGGDTVAVPTPSDPEPLPHYPQLTQADCRRFAEYDMQNRTTRYHVLDDTGMTRHPENGIASRHVRDEVWTIEPGDPLSSKAECRHEFWLIRDGTELRTLTRTSMTVDETHYYLDARLAAFENDDQIFERQWQDTIKRDFT